MRNRLEESTYLVKCRSPKEFFKKLSSNEFFFDFLTFSEKVKIFVEILVTAPVGPNHVRQSWPGIWSVGNWIGRNPMLGPPCSFVAMTLNQKGVLLVFLIQILDRGVDGFLERTSTRRRVDARRRRLVDVAGRG